MSKREPASGCFYVVKVEEKSALGPYHRFWLASESDGRRRSSWVVEAYHYRCAVSLPGQFRFASAAEARRAFKSWFDAFDRVAYREATPTGSRAAYREAYVSRIEVVRWTVEPA